MNNNTVKDEKLKEVNGGQQITPDIAGIGAAVYGKDVPGDNGKLFGPQAGNTRTTK